FIGTTGLFGLGLLAGVSDSLNSAMTPDAGAVKGRRAIDPTSLARYVDALPIPSIANPVGVRPHPADSARKVPFYRIQMREFRSKLHRDLKPTRQWGFDAMVPGPTLVTRRGEPLIVEWVNALPEQHFLPIDHNLHGAEIGLPEVRTVVHVHGAKAPPESDGYPDHWYTPGKAALAFYPNEQDAAMLWYHDHAMGINRLNIFAGLVGVYLVRDDFEDSLHLPRGEYEVPLV